MPAVNAHNQVMYWVLHTATGLLVCMLSPNSESTSV